MLQKMIVKNNISLEDKAAIQIAKNKMEHLGWAMKGLNKMGNAIENKLALLPQKQQQWLQKLSYKVLQGIVKSNLLSMNPDRSAIPLNKTYKALVTSSGIIGGALGASAFAVDLTLSTKLMMRSIMDIARKEGEDLKSLDSQLACLQVFALGGRSKHDDGLETGYYATRIMLNSSISGATKVSGKLLEGMLKNTTNPLLRLVSAVASRFSIQVSEKFIAQAIPVLGAAGGATINLAFINHFQNMAQAHFSIRRLERKYGEEMVRKCYEEITC